MRCSAGPAFAVVCSVRGGSSTGSGVAGFGAGVSLAAAAGGAGRSTRGAAARCGSGVVRGAGPSIGGAPVTVGSLSIGDERARGGASGVSSAGPPGWALAWAFAQPAAAAADTMSAARAITRGKPVTLLLWTRRRPPQPSSLGQEHAECGAAAGGGLHFDLPVHELDGAIHQ